MGRLQIFVDEQPGHAAMALAGELDMIEADRLADELLRLELRQPQRILLDLSGLTFLDSHGLAALLDAAEQSASLGCRLLLVPPPEPIMGIFRVTLLDRRFEWARALADPAAPSRWVGHGHDTRGERHTRDPASEIGGPTEREKSV